MCQPGGSPAGHNSWPPVYSAAGSMVTMTVVLLHPLPLDGSMWDAVAGRLGPVPVVAPTLYPLGESVEDWAAAVVDLCPAGPLTVVGCSVGGSCAIEVARLVPDRVDLLVLCGTKAGHRPQPDSRDEAVALLERGGMDAAWPRYWEPLFGPDADPGVVARARAIASSQAVADVVVGVRAFHSRVDRSAFVASWPRRLVVISGEHDIRPERSREMAARAVDGAFRLLSGAGHYTPMEAFAELAAIVVSERAAVLSSRG